ncbi:hypothetical protein KIL84_000833 [Mauremys mutica]|uniref:Uncharacterized protein n=1 Tax=Mauremys mutica TaxID=74926 RepID=A0A9D3WZR3_9SAUR|nr:hypothetical protein KIL84_000833 [Mauremys mutica]
MEVKVCRVGYAIFKSSFMSDPPENQLVKAILPSLGKNTINSAIPGMDSQLRPDIFMTNVEKKKVLMVDVMVPFENRSPAFHQA